MTTRTFTHQQRHAAVAELSTHSAQEVADKYGISRTTLYRWRAMHQPISASIDALPIPLDVQLAITLLGATNQKQWVMDTIDISNSAYLRIRRAHVDTPPYLEYKRQVRTAEAPSPQDVVTKFAKQQAHFKDLQGQDQVAHKYARRNSILAYVLLTAISEVIKGDAPPIDQERATALYKDAVDRVNAMNDEFQAMEEAFNG